MTLGQAIEKDIKDTILVVPKQTLTEIAREYKAVSYTHLTLPTILLV